MTGERLDVAIIGGGVAGMTVAHRLQADAPELDIALFEATDRLGGKIRSETVVNDAGTFIVEGAADAVLAQKPWAIELMRELGLGDHLIPINQVPRPASILKQGRIVPIPTGVNLLAPAEIGSFLRSPLLTPAGRMRALLDLALPASESTEDESLASFVRRRLGPETLDWLAEPLMAGIYNADPERMSLDATFPQFRTIEREQRSLIRGVRRARQTRQGTPRPPAFMSLRSGMNELADALAASVARIAQVNAPVESLDSQPDGVYRLRFRDHSSIDARRVVLALPAAQAARLLQPFAPVAASHLATLRTVGAGSITLAYPTVAIPRPLPGYGLLAPATSHAPFNAITVSSAKFPGRAPAGWTLLRIFFGGYRSPESMLIGDDELLQTIRAQLHHIMGIEAEPALHRITRWPSGSPQYDVGHRERIAAIDAALPSGLVVTGNAYRGVGLPDIVHDATRVAAQLQESSSRFLAERNR